MKNSSLTKLNSLANTIIVTLTLVITWMLAVWIHDVNKRLKIIESSTNSTTPSVQTDNTYSLMFRHTPKGDDYIKVTEEGDTISLPLDSLVLYLSE